MSEVSRKSRSRMASKLGFGLCVLMFGGWGAAGCTSDPCDDATSGDFAVKVVYVYSTDCHYSGRVIRKEAQGDVEQDMECKPVDGYCTCSGGDDFGDYEVYITDEDTGVTESAELTVEPNSATCVNRNYTSKFTVVGGDGGAGGMGGAP